MLMHSTFQALLRSADPAGRVHFRLSDQSYLEREEGASDQQFWLSHVLWFMDTFSVFAVRFERVKSVRKELDIQVTAIPGEDDYIISFNLAAMLGLPGDNVTAEFSELLNFVESWKPFFFEFASSRPMVRFFNNRTRNRKTYGSISFTVRLDGADRNSEAEAYAQAATDVVSQSPVLSHWMRNLALTLNKIGPWSWCTFNAEKLFEPEENPCHAARHTARAAQQSSECVPGQTVAN